MVPEIYSEHEFFLKDKFEKEIKNAVKKIGSGLKPSINFSNDLRIISVDLITQSTQPFFKNIEINRDLEKGIKDFADQQVLTGSYYRMVETASSDANFLNRFGRLHKEGQALDYYTTTPFIFAVDKALHGNNLMNAETELQSLKKLPLFRQSIHFNEGVKDTEKTIRFIKPLSKKQYPLHQAIYYAKDEDIPLCDYSTTTEQPVFYENELVMGVTLKLTNADGHSATLHVPRCFMDGFEPLVSGYTVEADGSRNGFIYYDWLIAEQGLLHHLRYGDLSDQTNSIEYIRSHLRFGVDATVQYHKQVYTLPTANYAPVQSIDFIAMLMNSNKNIEPVLITIKRSGEINVLNSRLKPLVLPDNNHLNLGLIGEHLEGLFSSNRTYAFYLINEIRKTMGAVNMGFAEQKGYIFLP